MEKRRDQCRVKESWVCGVFFSEWEWCNIPGYPSSGPRGCQVTTARCTPTPHPSPSIHTGWVVASGNRTPNLTFTTTGSICWCARGVKGQVGGSIPTGNNPPSMNGRRRVRGWGASGCSNLTASGTREGAVSYTHLDVYKRQQPTQYEWTEKGEGLGCIGL
ncbi:hypothetical protein DEO72_LG5g2921 [Vigna unguiculata]|uniref:Uncharacterized protein n=1 Tax=Vigna unguiculata TaxID=3917 RepID=A0A4D6M0Z3_VIGUN|nr:hypothetical protein DEO72_LG5g2921 [Vigna unguiculata]